MMKRPFYCLLLFAAVGCRAQQQIVPLNTYYKDAPNNSYLKDLNNELSPYVGTYKAIFNGRETTLYITKHDQVLNDRTTRQFYRDELHIKYIVKDLSTGIILEDTQNFQPINRRNEIHSNGTNPMKNNSINLIYLGTECGIGWGSIRLKKISDTQITWSFYPESELFSNGECPNLQNIKVYLPHTKNLIFTKQ